LISFFNSSPGKDSRLTEPESGFTAASHSPSGEMAMAEAETPVPLNATAVVGAVGVALGGDSSSGNCGAQAAAIKTMMSEQKTLRYISFSYSVPGAGEIEHSLQPDYPDQPAKTRSATAKNRQLADKVILRGNRLI
jgi:hypothetical protein